MAVKKPGASSKKASPRKSAAKIVTELSAIDMTELGSETEAEVRRRAYDLYQERGHQHGRDREDWFEAEAEVLSRLQKKESA